MDSVQDIGQVRKGRQEEPFKKYLLADEGTSHLEDKHVVILVLMGVMASSYTIHKWVESANCIVTFLGGSVVVYIVYNVLDRLMMKYSRRYRAITSRDNQLYVLSNTIKSFMLASFTPFCAHLLYECLICDHWNNTRISNLGSLYAICDFISLLVVRKMAVTTVLHHIAVLVFNAFSVTNDYSQENICRLIMVYAIFSTFAYLVNMLLASRFLGVRRSLLMLLSTSALITYALTCSVN
eukprot:Ihof_evm3s368 gene=Ihof_evmTU3s368